MQQRSLGLKKHVSSSRGKFVLGFFLLKRIENQTNFKFIFEEPAGHFLKQKLNTSILKQKFLRQYVNEIVGSVNSSSMTHNHYIDTYSPTSKNKSP